MNPGVLSERDVLRMRLYELSVQNPEADYELIEEIARKALGYHPKHLREDFCGSFAFCEEWIKRSPQHTALGIDLDPKPLVYGLRRSDAVLDSRQRQRLQLLHGDVRSVTKPLSELIVACNFSYFIFKQRQGLLEYFRAARASLKKGGGLFLEAAGGPGFVEKIKERREIRISKKERFTYIWDQSSFNPATHEGHYYIHFRVPGKGLIEKAFHYDWRVWSLPELRDILMEAGFRKVECFVELKRNGTTAYHKTWQAPNDHAWISYLVGVC